jgi:hypothetical protein
VGGEEVGLEILTRRKMHDMLHSGALNDRKRAEGGAKVDAGHWTLKTGCLKLETGNLKLET